MSYVLSVCQSVSLSVCLYAPEPGAFLGSPSPPSPASTQLTIRHTTHTTTTTTAPAGRGLQRRAHRRGCPLPREVRALVGLLAVSTRQAGIVGTQASLCLDGQTSTHPPKTNRPTHTDQSPSLPLPPHTLYRFPKHGDPAYRTQTLKAALANAGLFVLAATALSSAASYALQSGAGGGAGGK